MLVAVACDGNEVFQHFGQCSSFALFEIADGAVKSKKLGGTENSGHELLVPFLKAKKVELLICGGIGGGAEKAVSDSDIRIISGVMGDVDTVIRDFIAGKLVGNKNNTCEHANSGKRACACGGRC